MPLPGYLKHFVNNQITAIGYLFVFVHSIC